MHPVLKHGPKESDACASFRVTENLRHNKSEQVRPPHGRIVGRLILLSESFEWQVCWDSKDGEPQNKTKC